MNCKLVGNFVQHLEVTLSPGEEFYAEKGALIYHESGIERSTTTTGRGLGGLIGAKLTGESLLNVRFTNRSHADRKLVVGSRHGLLHVKLTGESLICKAGSYVASSARIDVSAKLSIAGLTGGMGALLQKISGSATVFLDTNGVPITVDLAHGEEIQVDEDHIIALQGIPESRMWAEWSLGNLFGGEGWSLLRVSGPGRVYLSPGTLREPVGER